MTDSTMLGDRMKRYELPTKMVLPRRTYTLLRVDGRSFHTLLKNANKPFDFHFIDYMRETARYLCSEISGSVFSYVQSDEISILLQDFENLGTEPWFNGEVQKMVSTSAALASVKFNDIRRYLCMPVLATFDSRVFTIPTQVEVANYFVWRQRDAVRNSISMAARAQFSHNQMYGVSSSELQDMLFVMKGINWNDYPVSAKRGSVVVKKFTRKEGIDHSEWVAEDAPNFVARPDSFLAEVIPPLPSLESE